MSLIYKLPQILEDSKTEYEKIKKEACTIPSFTAVEKRTAGAYGNDGKGSVFHGKDSSAGNNIFARGDNLEFMKYLLDHKNMEGRLQLVYMDPPFYSNASYDAVIKLYSCKIEDAPAVKPMAYDDHWKMGMEDYLRMLCVRFFFIKDLLSEEGCFWIHLDWHVVHYVKILMDEIFGEKNFVNEVIWNYKSGGTGKRNFSRKHDTLLFYSKSKKYYFNPLQEKSYNRGYKPYHFKGVEEFQDELGWYTMVNMKDVWQIDMVGRTSSERTGYATQKPELLLSRIIESCTREGDLCADFFSGSGTLAAAAEKLGRRWIACDIGGIAAANCIRRMSAQHSGFFVMEQTAADEPLPAGALRTEVFLAGRPAAFESDAVRKTASAQDTENPFAECAVTVNLTGYEPDIDRIPVQGADRDLVIEFIEKDPLQLLEYWSIDFEYDGIVHAPQYVFTKSNHNIEKTCSYPMVSARKGQALSVTGSDCNDDKYDTGTDLRISIRAVDVFGNSMSKIIEI